MRLVHVVVVLALAAGCSKKEGDKPAAKEGEGAAAPAPAPETPPAPDPAAAKPPAMTPEMLFADAPVWQIQMLDRGLYVRAGSGPVEHKCRQDLAMIVAQNGMLRMKAKSQVGATTCEPKAGYAVCTFKNPAPDPKLDPDGLTHWVFTGTDAEPLMVAILTGPQDDLDKVAPDLGKIESCPRPSDDPQ